MRRRMVRSAAYRSLIKDLARRSRRVQTSGTGPLRAARYTPATDSHLTSCFRRAGFVIVGITNSSELGIVPAARIQTYHRRAIRTIRRA